MNKEKQRNQHIRSLVRRFCEQCLSGNGWTFLCLVWIGLVVGIFLSVTVYWRPLEEVIPISQRVQHILGVWSEHGFWKLAGLGFSESPTVNPNAMVYKSRAPAFLYPLYFANVLNAHWQGEHFSFLLYVWYSQAIVWLSAACFGFLGVRLAKRLGTTPELALLCGIVGQCLLHTFPYNLEKYFEPMAMQISVLALILFLLIEEWSHERITNLACGLQGTCVFTMIYCNKDIAIPGLGFYFLASMLLNKKWQPVKMFCLVFAIILGFSVPALQVWFVKLKFPEISLVGATFMWRSGLDGATNYVGLLHPFQIGQADPFLRNVGVLSVLGLFWHILRGDQSLAGIPLMLVLTTIGFYILPGYLFSQSFQIHPSVYELFLPIVSILAWCYLLVPYWEKRTGNSGMLTVLLLIVGFCLCMYQLRVFAIRHPLSIPEPDWRSYLLFG